MSKEDTSTTLQELKGLVAKFRDERDWAKHHTPKNLAISIAIEAAELMEVFQWEENETKNIPKVKEELADVIIYCLNMADTVGVDIASIVIEKLGANAKKYPVALYKANDNSIEELRRIKQ